MNIEQFTKQLEEKGISLSSKQLQQFERYFELLVEWNEKMNLTAITEKNDVYLKHFFDSITAAFYVNFNEPLKICDVGAGAGCRGHRADPGSGAATPAGSGPGSALPATS